jgi:hypothetical protein
VRWADRIAYLPQDHADAVILGLAHPDRLPQLIRNELGSTFAQQRAALMHAVVQASQRTGVVSMDAPAAIAMGMLRQHNFDTFYTAGPINQQVDVVADAMQWALDRIAISIGLRGPLSAAACWRVIRELMVMDDAALLSYAGLLPEHAALSLRTAPLNPPNSRVEVISA